MGFPTAGRSHLRQTNSYKQGNSRSQRCPIPVTESTREPQRYYSTKVRRGPKAECSSNTYYCPAISFLVKFAPLIRSSMGPNPPEMPCGRVGLAWGPHAALLVRSRVRPELPSRTFCILRNSRNALLATTSSGIMWERLGSRSHHVMTGNLMCQRQHVRHANPYSVVYERPGAPSQHCRVDLDMRYFPSLIDDILILR